MSANNSSSEFEIIARYFSAIGLSYVSDGFLDLGIGDDCAIVTVPEDHQLAMSIDTLVADRHFPADAEPNDIARRALAVSVSDLAAMGAVPKAFTLALTLPDSNNDWLQHFAEGLALAADHYGIALIGGDTTKGPLSLSLQVHGLLPKGQGLKRSGAQPGDLVFASGYLGDAALALDIVQGRLKALGQQASYLLQRYYQPEARVALGQSLLGLATSAIDISDGLLADAAHIAKASQVGFELYADKLPVSSVTSQLLSRENYLPLAATGGDDYELCFTVPVASREAIKDVAAELSLPLTEIGRVVSVVDGECRVLCLDENNQPLEFNQTGFQHF